MFEKEVWRGQSNLQSLKGRSIPLSEWPSFVMPLLVSVSALLAGLLTLTGHDAASLAVLAAGALPFMAYVTRLYLLSKGNIALSQIVAFYGYYFPARAWGTVLGGFHTLGNNLHDR